MASLLEIVSKPISADEPCGPDLEQMEDQDYWQVIGRIEPSLPTSLPEYEKFPSRNMPIPAEIAAATKLLERSHDIKILTLVARLNILGQRLDGFIDAVEAMSFLIQERWDHFHPQGDIGYRLSLIECLDFMPDTGYPLRDTPLFPSPRLGKVSYRMHLLATGALSSQRLSVDENAEEQEEIAPRVNDISVAAKAAKSADIVASRDKLLTLLSMIEGMEANFTANAGSQTLRLTALKDLVSKILDFLNFCIAENDPSLAPPSGPPPGISIEEAAVAATSSPAFIGGVDSVESADALLAGVERYFANQEPSSPVRLYIAQARALVGKTFAEALEALVPEYASQANLPIGGAIRARLPLAQFAALLPSGPNPDRGTDPDGSGDDTEAESDSPSGVARKGARAGEQSGDSERQERVIEVTTRQAAIQSLEIVSGFFKQKEPSSAIPLLLGEARSFASRDFVDALRSVLPADAFVVDE